ncbi:MAG: reverse gyrase [Epsilonproteobacteria bacterium]|nr:reverse gyrase [Campylobacterota bacterium]
MIPLIYKQMCPGCGGDICSERLLAKALCKNCMPNLTTNPCEVESNYKKICEVEEKVKRFNLHFQKFTSSPLRELQKSWAKRFFLNNSFALLAPTGVGKTTFGLALSTFILPKKSYLLFPTQLLVQEALLRLNEAGYSPLGYHSKLSPKQKNLIKDRISVGDFEILVTTTNFFYKNFEIIPRVFEFVFIDDVDSILKSSKHIYEVLELVGFEKEDIKFVEEFHKLKEVKERELNRYKRQLEKIKQKRKANLIVSTATANPKSKRTFLFRELLGFEAGRARVFLRNIQDLYEEGEFKAISRIKQFGKGGLVFLPATSTKEELEDFTKKLNGSGIKAKTYLEFDKKEFLAGEVEVVVGFSSYNNPLARGLDLPQAVRYALFVGVPKIEFRLNLGNHLSLYNFLLALKRVLPKTALEWLEYLEKLRFQKKLSNEDQKRVALIEQELLGLLDEDMISRINSDPDLFLEYKEGVFRVVIADAVGYIQASGRTSRLYAQGLTKGVSLLLVDDLKAFNSLKKRVKWFSEEIEFKPIFEVDLEKLFLEVDLDRKKVKEAKEVKDIFKTALVVVESPNKARTIASFYGKPIVREYEGVKVFEIAKEDRILSIASTKGHIFDLVKDEGIYGVKEEDNFIELFEPLDEERLKRIDFIQKLDLENREVFIATDPDTEGEKIGYDLFLNSMLFNSNIKRAEFNEVTKRAFEEAIEGAREFNENLVKAQLVRRVADRWIGFTASKYVQEKFKRKHLSAGRVQTAVLEWIVLREYEAKEKVWAVKVDFGLEVEFIFNSQVEARAFFKGLDRAKLKKLSSSEKKIFYEPLTTQTLLANSAQKLKFSPSKTMQLAQDLFEAGLITYHRTDSKHISATGLNIAKEYILQTFGKEYLKLRNFSLGTHEAIRATKPLNRKELEEYLRLKPHFNLTKEHLDLYELIFSFFIASQMREAILEEVKAKVEVKDKAQEVNFFDKVIQHGADLMIPIEIKNLEEGEYKIKNKELFQRPKVPRYTYAQIVMMMKERGIGRPSTYAITLEKLLERKYIVEKRGVLFATKLGVKVYEEIKKNPEIYAFVNEHYTKELEELMERVEEGELEFQEVLKRLFDQVLKNQLRRNDESVY